MASEGGFYELFKGKSICDNHMPILHDGCRMVEG
jgi:hypothetical protein